MKKRAQKIIEILTVRGNITDTATAYGEPGYADPENGILLGNWDNVSRTIADYLEDNGFSLEWYNEWAIDYSSSKAYRTSANSYSWKPYYIQNDWTNGETTGGDGIESDENLAAEYVTDYLMNNSDAANLFDIDAVLEKLNFQEYPEIFESGYFEGMNDNPDKIGSELEKAGFDFVFGNLKTSQFYSTFSVYTRTAYSFVLKAANAYLQCALWCSEENGEYLDKNFGIDDIDENTFVYTIDHILGFLTEFSVGDRMQWDIDAATIGHCLWLSESGHGSGFFDQENLPQEWQDKLQEKAEQNGESWLYITDDNRIRLDRVDILSFSADDMPDYWDDEI